jgi:2-amino-4-hydroxy-6-hydroxymethyldihydropteridine diphosphokinase
VNPASEPVDSAGVSRQRGTIYIGLGTNLGDRVGNLHAAIAAMPPAVIVLRQSKIYETTPWGFHDQPDFLNQVIKARTNLAPLDLLHYLKDIEKRLGRKETFRYGPRLIDLDILFYDDLILELPELSIPHPHMAERAFVLAPLAEIIPNFRDPLSGKRLVDLLHGVNVEGVRLYSG